MKIEYRELYALRVWFITVDDEFAGMLVLDDAAPWEPVYHIHKYDPESKSFALYDTISAYNPPGVSMKLDETVTYMVEVSQ